LKIGMTLRPITEAPAYAQAPAGKQGSRLKAQSSKKDKSYKPLADSWTIFDNSRDVPKTIAFKEKAPGLHLHMSVIRS